MDPLCLSCQIVQGEAKPHVRPILETEHFHAHQDVAYPVPAQVIVAARRHVRCLDELTEAETRELLPLIRRIRGAQRSSLGIEHVYYFYNEDTKHHFHVWMVPRYPWMRQFGRSIESVRPALLHAREHMSGAALLAEVDQAANVLRKTLSP